MPAGIWTEFSPNTGKHRPEKTLNLDLFHQVYGLCDHYGKQNLPPPQSVYIFGGIEENGFHLNLQRSGYIPEKKGINVCYDFKLLEKSKSITKKEQNDPSKINKNMFEFDIKHDIKHFFEYDHRTQQLSKLNYHTRVRFCIFLSLFFCYLCLLYLFCYLCLQM